MPRRLRVMPVILKSSAISYRPHYADEHRLNRFDVCMGTYLGYEEKTTRTGDTTR